jgi:tRNA pseudouridine38-40 synthase
MQTYRLDLEYEGTRYRGWQAQRFVRTVQGEVIKAAEDIFQTKVEVMGAGRTDAGVHALRQVAHLKARDGKTELPGRKLAQELNDRLPHDINILGARAAPPRFHARHDAVSRWYLYQISTRRTAFGKDYVWWKKDRLNLLAMQEAARLIEGRHNFRTFCEVEDEKESTIVVVQTVQMFTAGHLVMFRIGASHFLWKMVRRLVGALVGVGTGKLTVNDFEKMFKQYSDLPAKMTAPPSGLFLERVCYEGDPPPEKPYSLIRVT